MKMDYKLTELIEQKSFEALSDVEKSFVLTHLTEEEYRQQNELISKVKNDLKNEAQHLKANDQIRINALEALRSKQQKTKSKVIPLWFNYKVPLWSAVAALLLVFILTTPLLLNTEIKELNGKEQIVMRDTVYVEKIINDTVEIIKPTDTIIKTVYINKKDKSSENKNIITPDFSTKKNELKESDMETVMASEVNLNPMDFQKRTLGKSLSEDPVGRVVLNISK